MRTPARWFRAATIAAAVGVLLPVALAPTAPAAPVVTATTADTTFTPSVVPVSATEIANPLRGQYRWIGQPSKPAGWPAPDGYDRDRTYWGMLEKTRGTYDFTRIENGLREAQAAGGKFGFRVMAYCPGCWMDNRTDWPKVVPPWMPTDSIGAPQWNSETFLATWEALWRELGRRYADDPRLGYVDVGGFGKYGEWMPPDNKLDVTAASADRIIDAVAKAFPRKHVLMGAVAVYTKPTVLQNALAEHPNLGLRSDCLGRNDMQKPENGFSEMWKTRPFFTEWCTTGDPVIAKAQVTDWHVSTVSSGNLRLTYDAMTSDQRAAYETLVKTAGYRYSVRSLTVSSLAPGKSFTVSMGLRNDGSAPTYDRWNARLVLSGGSGERVATLPLSLDLQTRLPGSSTFSQSLTLPSSLAAGPYTLSVEVVDPSGYSAPLRLANSGRTADGRYPLGTVAVSTGQVTTSPVVRLSGDTRYDASAAISAASFAPGVPVAYVATGKNFPDALSGGPAAARSGGPLLLVQPDALPQSIRDELTRLRPGRIVVLGGTASVSSAVRSALEAYTTGGVTRISGGTRYEASAAVSAATYSPGAPVAFVATGKNFPDALSGAPAAAELGGPVLLVQPGEVPDVVRTELVRLKPGRIVVLGGTASVSGSVASTLAGLTTGTVTRIADSDRYTTSAAISRASYAPRVPVVYVATGANFPDALSGTPVAGRAGGPILLVPSTSIPASIATELTRLQPGEIVVLGGPNSVSSAVASQLAAYVVP